MVSFTLEETCSRTNLAMALYLNPFEVSLKAKIFLKFLSSISCSSQPSVHSITGEVNHFILHPQLRPYKGCLKYERIEIFEGLLIRFFSFKK